MSDLDAARWIDLVIARSQDLRRAGVTSIGFQGCTASLEPLPPELPTGDDKPAQPEQALHYMHDPATYPDGLVPGFAIQRLDDGGF